MIDSTYKRVQASFFFFLFFFSFLQNQNQFRSHAGIIREENRGKGGKGGRGKGRVVTFRTGTIIGDTTQVNVALKTTTLCTWLLYRRQEKK